VHAYGPRGSHVGREVCGAGEHHARRLLPRLDERGLELAHDRTLDPHVGVAPLSLGAAVAQPPVRDPGSAGEPDAAVDDEHSSVVAMVHTSGGETPRRPEPVEQHVDGDTRATPAGELAKEPLAHHAVLVVVLRVGDRRRRLADAGEQGGKDLVTVQQDVDAVAVHDGGARDALERGAKRRVVDGDPDRGDRWQARRAAGEHQREREPR
jgi:hypothetical protein